MNSLHRKEFVKILFMVNCFEEKKNKKFLFFVKTF